MAFDFKKKCRELYAPKAAPGIVTVPRANFIAIEGQGDPNQEGGAYGPWPYCTRWRIP